MIRDHILFVEDDRNVRREVFTCLVEEFPDYVVEAVDSVKEAKKALQKARRKDLLTRVVVVDEDLGEKDSRDRGSAFLTFLQRYYPGIRKIMLEARARPQDISMALNLGKLDKYVHKGDFDRDKDILFDAIRSALKERDGIQEAIIELLKEADSEDPCEAAVLMAGNRRITTKELLQNIAHDTKFARNHKKRFTKLLYSFFLRPEEFLSEMKKIEQEGKQVGKKHRKSKKAKG
jgi:DNA-binding NarL/FixJ family response regulator